MLNKTVPNNIIPKPTRYIEALSIFANTEAENPIPEKTPSVLQQRFQE